MQPYLCLSANFLKQATRSVISVKGAFRTKKKVGERQNDAEYRKPLTQLAKEQKFEYESNKKKRIHWSWSAVTLLVLPATTFSLGCWQVRRLKWKENILSDIRDRMQQKVVPLPENDLKDWEDFTHRKVRLKGNFLYDKELIFKMKRRSEKGKNGLGGFLKEPGDGFFIISPFKLSNSGRVIMVNRGWLPMEKEDPQSRLSSQINDEVVFEALVPPTKEKRWLLKLQDKTQLLQVNKGGENRWQLKNIHEVAKLLNAEPVLVDAMNGLSVPDGPVEGKTDYEPSNNHLSYVITWYSLTAFMSLMWWMRYVW